MSIWITSDTHFGHENIIHYENRPFLSVDEMDESLILRWNSLVKPNDLIYHLGDFGFGPKHKLLTIRKRLNGKITLVIGNHDPSLATLMEIGFDSICNEIKLHYKQWQFHMTHTPQSDLIYDEMETSFLNLHGHVHGKNRANRNRINVSCDSWDYMPISLDDALMEYRKQRKNKYD